jgi:hypothetical protein
MDCFSGIDPRHYWRGFPRGAERMVKASPVRVCLTTPDLLRLLTRAALHITGSTRHSFPSRDRKGVGSGFSRRLGRAGE